MRVSEVIEKLEEIKEEHGDLRVYYLDIDYIKGSPSEETGWLLSLVVICGKEERP